MRSILFLLHFPPLLQSVQSVIFFFFFYRCFCCECLSSYRCKRLKAELGAPVGWGGAKVTRSGVPQVRSSRPHLLIAFPSQPNLRGCGAGKGDCSVCFFFSRFSGRPPLLPPPLPPQRAHRLITWNTCVVHLSPCPSQEDLHNIHNTGAFVAVKPLNHSRLLFLLPFPWCRIYFISYYNCGLILRWDSFFFAMDCKISSLIFHLACWTCGR